jgi:regulator of sirC expression with transglutaminase-like and TPR domain
LAPVDATARFGDLLREDAPALDVGALLIAAHAHPHLDVDACLARLDDLAARCSSPTVEELNRVLFAEYGLGPNIDDYYDPRNSFLDDVLERRVGIPITLAVVMLEVGRRAGVGLHGVGMPGHFLVSDGQMFYDPFDRGAPLAIADPVVPASNQSILYRMLNNLRGIYTGNGDLESLRWVLRLRTLFPDAPASDHHEHTRAVARLN